MLNSIFASKIGMTQAWDKSGKRWAVTKCKVDSNVVLGFNGSQPEDTRQMYLIGYGTKKLKNMNKPLRSLVEKSGFSEGVAHIKGVEANDEATEELTPGTTIEAEQVLSVGDVVKVQGTTKGRGFAGAMKRHGFHGGPRTHGQSDRARAVGSIGAGTTPGKVLKGKKMPGHYGAETNTVKGLVVLHIDPENREVWLSGPVPGALSSTVRISPTGKTKTIDIDTDASGIVVKPTPEAPAAEAASEEAKE